MVIVLHTQSGQGTDVTSLSLKLNQYVRYKWKLADEAVRQAVQVPRTKTGDAFHKLFYEIPIDVDPKHNRNEAVCGECSILLPVDSLRLT